MPTANAEDLFADPRKKRPRKKSEKKTQVWTVFPADLATDKNKRIWIEKVEKVSADSYLQQLSSRLGSIFSNERRGARSDSEGSVGKFSASRVFRHLQVDAPRW